MLNLILVIALLSSMTPPAIAADDPRDDYDVKTYRLDLKVDPATSTLSGTGVITATVTADRLATFVVDLMKGREVSKVNAVTAPVTPDGPLSGPALKYEREGDAIRILLPRPAARGSEVRVAITYSLDTRAVQGRTGIRFAKTPDGKPWIVTSCQNTGAHSWWPCKAETTHPEDKHERIFINATVPKGLTAVANGRLLRTSVPRAGWETFHWRHDYPCEGYAVALNVAPYTEVKTTLTLPGLNKPVPFHYWVLPADLEKAKLEFAEVPRMMKIFSEAFGPYPFPESKLALVHVNYWGMEHSTVVAYGNSFPAWIKKYGGKDQYAGYNRLFDYILIHETAHEWWGNAVSVTDWGHFWVHEGFGTYAEGVYVEKVYGLDEADRYFASMRPSISKTVPVARRDKPVASAGYHLNIYYKGANVLHTLRHYVNDDAKWWKVVRDFNMKFRYKNASTEDFRTLLERETGRDWRAFFEQWVYGNGWPNLTGTVSAADGKIIVEVDNPEQGGSGFDVPLDLAWTEGGQAKTRRLMLKPGANRVEIPCAARPRDLKVVNLIRLMGEHKVTVR